MPNLRKQRKQSFGRLNGTFTSVSLEEAFWDAFKEIAQEEGISPTKLARRIDRDRVQANLTSAIRLFVLNHFVARYRSATGPAHDRQKSRPGRAGFVPDTLAEERAD
jgi:predicted DNA-binding ribbon-helix-helix protein